MPEGRNDVNQLLLSLRVDVFLSVLHSSEMIEETQLRQLVRRYLCPEILYETKRRTSSTWFSTLVEFLSADGGAADSSHHDIPAEQHDGTACAEPKGGASCSNSSSERREETAIRVVHENHCYARAVEALGLTFRHGGGAVEDPSKICSVGVTDSYMQEWCWRHVSSVRRKRSAEQRETRTPPDPEEGLQPWTSRSGELQIRERRRIQHQRELHQQFSILSDTPPLLDIFYLPESGVWGWDQSRMNTKKLNLASVLPRDVFSGTLRVAESPGSMAASFAHSGLSNAELEAAQASTRQSFAARGDWFVRAKKSIIAPAEQEEEEEAKLSSPAAAGLLQLFLYCFRFLMSRT